MSEIINAGVAGLNSAGRGVCEYAVGMFLQSGVLVAVLLIVDFFLRKRIRATLRYWIWMLVFIKLLLPPTVSIPTGIGYWFGRYVSPAPAVSQQARETGGIPMLAEMDASTEMPPEQPFHPVPAVIEPVESAAVAGESLTWQGGAFLLWGAGVLAFAGLVIQRLLFVKELIAQGQPAQDDLVAVLAQCRRRLGVRREVGLKLSPNTFSPAVCGLFRLTILIPAGLLDRLSPENLKAVLIHELAHVRRGDLWINSLQTLLQIVYFYNPLVWLANAIVRRVREQAVDEMVLVALGAEARSYSRTLIDIAEMAFLRASPALRLIGVAESRKSLEGRIRHMMTRPIPKSARVGIAGVLVVAAIGAILLPMARATVEPQQRFVAKLPGGATVELVGVCNWPASDPIAWRPDGSALDQPLYASKWNVRPRPGDYGFVLHITGPNDLEVQWNRIEGADSWEGSCDVVDAQGNRLDAHDAAVALVKDGVTQTGLRVGFAMGPWTTISSHDGKEMSIGGRTGVLWSQAFEDPGGTSVVTTAEWRKDWTERVVAIDAAGVIRAVPGGSVAVGNMDQMTTRFAGLKFSQIKEFQFQLRPYQWVEFQGVSLAPGQRTDVQVQTESRPVAPATEQLKQAAGDPRLPDDSVALADRSGKGWDVAAERFDVHPASTQGTYRAVVSIRNRGGATCPQVAVRFYAGDPAVDSPVHAAGPLKPDEVWNETSSEFTLRDGVHEIRASLDPDNWVEELDETNNRAALRIRVKDGKIVEQSVISAAVGQAESGEVFQSYEVNRSVAEFPQEEDFSTPESAYATINRMDRGDSSAWQKVSVARLADRFSRDDSDRKRTVDPEWTKVLSNARIRAVMAWNMTRAAVMAELPQESSGKKIADPIDVRFLQLENGRWLNTGNDRFPSIEAAKAHFMGWMKRDTAQADMMRDPLRHAGEIKEAAAQLFERLRTADYADILSYYRDGKWEDDGWKKFPTQGLYMVHTDYPSFALWCCTHFKDNPIVDVELGEVFIGDSIVIDKTGWPTVPYKLTLKDGTVLAGNLPFNYVVNQGKGHWHGMEGIDWHLWADRTK